MLIITIASIAALSSAEIQPLLDASRAEGLHLVERLADDHASGANRFDQEGETLLGAYVAGQLVGVGGVNRDPYASAAHIGRLRHLYVLPAWRRRGVGQQLVTALVAAATPHFAILQLRTTNPAAARFYQRIGFAAVSGDANATHALDLCPCACIHGMKGQARSKRGATSLRADDGRVKVVSAISWKLFE